MLVLPDSLLLAESEAIGTLHLDRLVLPACSVNLNGLYGMSIDCLQIPAGYTGVMDPDTWEYTYVGRFEVEAGNPLYSDRDGVLFSADGKVLLAYPILRKALVYEVPAGTSEIANGAFADTMMSIPLQSITLPIGLKKIGAYAFSGCGRLQSLTIPLTVTDLDPTALLDCVSLERLSLPAHLQPLYDQLNGGLLGDFTHYTGDNGEAIQSADPWADEEEFEEEDGEDSEALARYFWIDGTAPVPAYAASTGSTVLLTLEPGSVMYFDGIYQDGRWRTYLSDLGEKGWVEDASLLVCHQDSLFTWGDCTCSDRPKAVLSSVTGSFAGFYEAERGIWEDIFLGDPRLNLVRQHTRDSRTMGILLAQAPGVQIPLWNLPDGQTTAHVYSGEQCVILTEEAGWTQIRMHSGTYWTLSALVRVIPQEERTAGE